MVVIGGALVIFGYSVAIWGYCLIRGYDVPFSGLWGGAWPAGATGQQPFTPGTNPSTGVTLT